MSEGPFVKSCIQASMQVLLAKHPHKDRILDQINGLQLSRQTVTERAEIISNLIQSEIKILIDQSIAFSICCDESTDINQVSQLVIYARIVDDHLKIKDTLIDILPMHETTKSSDIYQKIIESLQRYGKGPKDVTSITTDGAKSMRGVKEGVTAKLKRDNNNLIDLHCILHQEDLVAKKSIPAAKVYSDKVMLIVNKCMSSGALRCRQFKAFLDENGSDIQKLSKMAQVRWLSVNKTFSEFISIIDLIYEFLKDQKIVFEELKNQDWIEKLAFLTDLTGHFSILNKKLQGSFCFF